MEKATSSLQAPKFLSEKPTNDAAGERRSSNSDIVGATELLSLKQDVPIEYENVEIKYSKFGVDDFDFGLVTAWFIMHFY